jgi:hypothetical protein
MKPDPPRAIIIRNVPESVRRELKARAAKEGKSMQAVIVGLITWYATEMPEDVRILFGDPTAIRPRGVIHATGGKKGAKR